MAKNGKIGEMEKKWLNFNFDKLTVREAFRKLEGYVDSSDPDSSFPNLEHMLQTAESIREAGHPDWFQLVGLIHDMVYFVLIILSCQILLIIKDRIYEF